MQEKLPNWNLDDLYSGTEDIQIQKDLQKIENISKNFSKEYKGKLKTVSGDALFCAMQSYEELSEMVGKIMSFAGLLYAVKSTDAAVGGFYQNMMEKITQLSEHTVFFTLEINGLSDEELAQKIESSTDLKYYESWLNDVRVGRKYQLSDEMETLLHKKSASGRSAWVRLFDQTMAGLTFDIDGVAHNESQILNLMCDTNENVRKTATLEMGRVLKNTMPTLHLITNTLAKDKQTMDDVRGFETPVTARNISNMVQDHVVDALESAVVNKYESISHRYYAIKAKWMGKEKLHMWDRNAPLPKSDTAKIPYETAVETVLSAYKDFSTDLHGIAVQFFDNDWIDVGVKDGKRSGAFAHPCVPSVHPYLLLNYQGKNRDVMTLAHELGHGCHQVLAGKQGHLKSQTPLTLAETASVFGEMLTFKKLLNAEQDTDKKRLLLAGKIEDMINTVVRQISFYRFEKKVHTARKQGEVSAETLGQFWLETSKESLGDSFIYEEYYNDFWAYIPHFVHSPFYVYAYAFGDCLVNSLYALYEKGYKDFDTLYMELLSAGGSKKHAELLQPFGLDATQPEFWEQGLSVIEGFIDSLEETFK